MEGPAGHLDSVESHRLQGAGIRRLGTPKNLRSRGYCRVPILLSLDGHRASDDHRDRSRRKRRLQRQTFALRASRRYASASAPAGSASMCRIQASRSCAMTLRSHMQAIGSSSVAGRSC